MTQIVFIIVNLLITAYLLNLTARDRENETEKVGSRDVGRDVESPYTRLKGRQHAHHS